MKLFRPTTILFSGFLLACCYGCHEKPATLVLPDNKPEHIKEAKPGAAIRLISSVVSIKANEASQVELVFDVRESAGTLNIELVPTNGLVVLDTQMTQSIPFSSATIIKVPVKLHVDANGRYYLNIHANIDTSDMQSSRSLALIVQVGTEQEKSAQLKKPAGDNVISLPAQETISNQ